MKLEDFQALLDARNQAQADHESACSDGEPDAAAMARSYARLTELQDQIDTALAEASKETPQS